jgi:hypothetical protein
VNYGTVVTLQFHLQGSQLEPIKKLVTLTGFVCDFPEVYPHKLWGSTFIRQLLLPSESFQFIVHPSLNAT